MPPRKHDRIRLGVASLVWGFDLSEQERMEWFLREASEIGYEGIVVFEQSVLPWIDRPAEFRDLLGTYKLDFAGAILRPHLDFAMTDRLTKFMAAAGAEVMNISGRDGTKAEWDIVLPALRRHAEIAHANGIRAVYQHHTGWIVEDEEDYERLLRETDRAYFGVMTDCGHATKDFKKITAAEFIRKHPELDYIELKDWTPQTDLNTEVGRGLCDWPAVAEAIRAIDYKGWVVVEQNSSFRPAKVSAAESYHYVRTVMGL
jgi:sugar phosphate isomerase/epimerase